MLSSIDMHGEPVSLKVKGKSTYPSLFGMLVSLISLGILIAFGMDKFMMMTESGDTTYSSTQREI